MRGLLPIIILVLMQHAAAQEIIPLDEPIYPDKTPQRDTDAILSWFDEASLLANINFGGWTGDYFFEYFVPAADGYIHEIVFNMSDLPDSIGGSLSFWVFEYQYHWPELSTTSLADECLDAHLGYKQDSLLGVNPLHGDWVQGAINLVEGADPEFEYNPIGLQLEPPFGAASVSVLPNADDAGAVTAQIVTIMVPWQIYRDQPFVLLVRLNGWPEGGTLDEYRMGFRAGHFPTHEPQPGLKFYGTNSSPYGRCGTEEDPLNDWGWYIRSYVWDWDIHVTYTSDRGPEIEELASLATVLWTDPGFVQANVTDDNPGSGPAGVDSVMVVYRVDQGPWQTVPMDDQGDDLYSGWIPTQPTATEVDYYIRAVDVEGLDTETLHQTFTIIRIQSPFLFIYDAAEPIDNPRNMYTHYYGVNSPAADSVMWDIWKGAEWGPVTLEFLQYYRLIYWASDFYPANMMDGSLHQWMQQASEDSPRFLFITGQDFLRAIPSWGPPFFPGDFAYDYLGITNYFEDYLAGYDDPTLILASENDPLSGYLTSEEDSLYYAPGIMNQGNRVDELILNENGTAWLFDGDRNNSPLAVWAEGDYWKAAFTQVHPYCILQVSNGDTLNVAADIENIWNRVFQWFDPDFVGLDPPTHTPRTSQLHQAFPNPFNPATQLSYEIAKPEEVEITVYNLLGQQIITLHDGLLGPGIYTTEWNASSEPGGIYLVRMLTEQSAITRKVVLLK